METVIALISENGPVMLVIGLFLAVAGFGIKLNRYKKGSIDIKKAEQDFQHQSDKKLKDDEDSRLAKKAIFTTSISLTEAKKTTELNSLQKLDSGSFITIDITLKNTGQETIIVESLYFIGKEEHVDNSYGNDILKDFNINFLDGNEVDIKPDDSKLFTDTYKIGRNFHSRLRSYATVETRLGNHPSSSKKFGLALRHMY